MITNPDKIIHLQNLYIKSKPDIHNWLISYLPINIFLVDAEGYIAWGNERMLKTLNLNSLSDFVGKHVSYWDNSRWDYCLEVIKTKREITEEETANGSFYLTVRRPLLDFNGEVIGVLGISYDITAQKRAEIAKSEFLMDMSHDLRTPFSGILAVSNVLYEQEKDPAKKEMQGLVVQSARRLLSLLDQVLEITNLGSKPLTYTDINLKEAINEVIELLDAEINFKGLSLSLYCPEITINTDKMRFNRILLNLMSNAVKFTHQGHIIVQVALKSHLHLSISDTGIGIPQDKLEFIFNKFAKLKRSNTEKNFPGSGIGLYIVKQFVDELGGTIQVQSQLGKGSAFTVSLPFINV